VLFRKHVQENLGCRTTCRNRIGGSYFA